MYRLNICGENVYLEDVKSSELPRILEWYNKTDDYIYATGKEKATSMVELWKKYQDFLENPNVFFASIYKKEDGEAVGILKGYFLKDRKDALWIGILLILKEHQKLGYGRDAISSFFNKIRREKTVKTVYLSCPKHNVQGLEFWRKVGFISSENVHAKRDVDSVLKDISILELEI